MATTARPRLLVKTRPGRTMPRRGFRFESMKFRAEPLFAQRGKRGFELAGGERWYLVEAAEELDRETDPWDFAHNARKERLGFAVADAPSIIEPDLLQDWSYRNQAPLVGDDEAFAADEVCVFNDQRSRGGATPVGPAFGWFLGVDGRPFSQLRAAREAVATPARRARVGHVDTGYDDTHVTRPARLSRELQRNFLRGEDEADARDPANRGLIANPGHGTGTLGILAGNVLAGVTEAGPLRDLPLGGAPEAEIVPVRAASSVAQFFTSAIARAFAYLTDNKADVISMSMGGLPSAAWTDAINAAYDAGVFMVAAAGNNFRGLPTRFIVYPARYRRVVAACGAMADDSPYTGLPIRIMQGNWGPRRKMRTAMAAYTPNLPWAELGCARIVDMDGQGTSSATPQIAAAAALWIMKHDPSYRHGWQKVEAVRTALFQAAQAGDEERLGRGILRAADALAVAPPAVSRLRRMPRDRAGMPILRLLFGLGVAGRSPRIRMLELEAAQRFQSSHALEQLLIEHGVDPDVEPTRLAPRVQQELLEALVETPGCSRALRRHLERYHVAGRGRGTVAGASPAGAPASALAPDYPAPRSRALAIYTFDPGLGLELETAVLNTTVVDIPWEDLRPGPVGEYVEVVDVDPASGCAYAPVDLDHPRLLARRGLEPSEGNPQFHQQMVYAVAMKTIHNFERALGRSALWSQRRVRRESPDGHRRWRNDFVPRLRIYPHALREANAFYSPERKALLFGYFPASWDDRGENLPGGMVFTCLSHDVVAHETTHALLDGLHSRFAEPSNADVFAFHEAFADVVALFQHFSFPAALRQQIEKTRGDLARQNLLGELAQQFGEAIGHRGALRSAIGQTDEKTGEWRPHEPDPEEYRTTAEPHERGAILVAAVFDAFLAIYKHRVRDLLRLASGGTGVLPEGAIHPDLVGRLADAAARTAQHVLTICIRALDYCPPVDVTFGEYLRALITADSDLVPEDDRNYRVAFIEAFRRRGIFPAGIRTLSVESLRWRSPDSLRELVDLDRLLRKLDLTWDLETDRRRAYDQARRNQGLFHRWAKEKLLVDHRCLRELGLAWGDSAPERIARDRRGEVATEIHSVRPARRLAPDGSFVTELVVEITQRRREPLDPARPEDGELAFRGGCTLLIDPRRRQVRYSIQKDIRSEERLERQRRFEASPREAALYATYFGDGRRDRDEPFALLHRGHGKRG